MRLAVCVGCLGVAILMLLPRPANRRLRAVPVTTDDRIHGVSLSQDDPVTVGSPGSLTGGQRLVSARVWLERRMWATRRRRSREAAAIELVSAFAAELRAGQPVPAAFARAQRSSPVPIAQHAVAIAELGGDVPRALVKEAADLGLPVLASLAALWRVADGSGAGLAVAASRLADAEAAVQVSRSEVQTQLASPRATARVLAGLPIIGLMLGSGLGASPVAWLVGSVPGVLVLVVGLGLEVAGLWWMSRLTKSVERLL